MYRSFIFILLSLCYCLCKEHVERNLYTKIFPIECPNNSTIHVIHVLATNAKLKTDVIHYIWTGVGRPTIVMKHTMSQTPLEIVVNTTNICKGEGKSLNFYPDNKDVTGIIINKVFAYEDQDDKVSLKNVHSQPDIAQNFTWNLYQSNGIYATFEGKTPYSKGEIIFETKVHQKSGHSDLLPHNPITANLTEFTLILKNLPRPYGKTRYAVEVVFFSTSPAGHFDTVKYIDDEFTPGVFDIWAAHLSSNAYSTWKPVSYNSKDRSRKTQGFAFNFAGNSRMHDKGQLPQYKKKDNMTWTIVDQQSNVVFFAMNLTFGVAKDGCYNANPYTSWVGMAGIGTPPTDGISETTLIIIIVGVGSPGLAILMAVFYLVVRKVRLTRKNKYDQIN